MDSVNLDFKSTLPNLYTKVLARQLVKQLRESWQGREINMVLGKSLMWATLLALINFEKALDTVCNMY